MYETLEKALQSKLYCTHHTIITQSCNASMFLYCIIRSSILCFASGIMRGIQGRSLRIILFCHRHSSAPVVYSCVYRSGAPGNHSVRNLSALCGLNFLCIVPHGICAHTTPHSTDITLASLHRYTPPCCKTMRWPGLACRVLTKAQARIPPYWTIHAIRMEWSCILPQVREHDKQITCTS
jgi:hypothetical protein